MRAPHLTIAVLLAAPLGLPLAGVRAAEPAAGRPQDQRYFNPRLTPVVDLVKRVKSCVVNIHSERSVRAGQGEEFLALAPSQNRVNGMGTGIIIDPRGYIITNHHVVEDVNAIRVRLVDGTVTAAQVVARDAESDLALLKIEVNRALPVMPFGTATDLMVGETVVAIGNAYGYDHTVSTGIVSALHRDVTLNKEVSYKNLIQTDAAINPGNSGGPLLNIRGELIGVNVAIRAGAQGIGFAIPVDAMMRVAADLISPSRKGQASLGAVLRDRVIPREGQAPDRELLVEGVEPSGLAARAGLQSGDRIVRADRQPITCRLELERQLLDRNVGDSMIVEVSRSGAEKQLKLVLAEGEKANPLAADVTWKRLGVRLQRVGAEVVNGTNKQLQGGMMVDEVRADSPAARAGIQRGDILVGLHQWEMLSLDNVAFVLTHPELATFSPLRFYIVRAAQVHRGFFQIGE